MATIKNSYITCNFSISSKNSSGQFTISASFTNSGFDPIMNVRLSCSLTNGSPWTQINVGTIQANGSASGSTTISSGNTGAQNVYCYLLIGGATSGNGGAFSVGAYVPPTPPTPTYSHTITYNANGGTNAPPNYSSTTTTQGSFSARISDQMPTRDNFIFIGWATSSSSKVAQYYPSTQYTFSSQSITLYAVWKRKQNVRVMWNDIELDVYKGEIPIEVNKGDRDE